MVEIMIDCWTKADSDTAYLWSVWREGQRIQLGPNAYSDADACEAAARDYCVTELGAPPDRVTHL